MRQHNFEHGSGFGFAASLLASLLLIMTFWTATARGISSPDGEEIEPARTLAGHTDGVHALAFFPDGKRLVSASHDRTLRIWDVATGRPLMTITGHEGAVWAVDVSPDGKRIASAGSDKTARVWDANTGAQLAQVNGHTAAIRGVAFLPGNRLVTGAARPDGTVRMWDLATEREIWRADSEDCVLAMGLNAVRNRIAFGGCDGVVRVWDLVARRKLAEFPMDGFKAGGGSVREVVWSGDGRNVYTGNSFDLTPWAVDRRAFGPKPPRKILSDDHFAISSDGRLLITGAGFLIDLPSGEPIRQFLPVFGAVGGANCVALSPDNHWVAMGGGGSGLEDGNWRPTKANFISIYPVPQFTGSPTAAATPGATTGPAVGPITWDVLPVRVRGTDGKVQPLASRPYRDFSQNVRWRFRTAPATAPSAKPADLIIGDDIAYLHREPGTFDELPIKRSDHIEDATWDGAHFWISTSQDGVIAVELNAKVVAKVGPAQGLAPGLGYNGVLRAVGRDRVLIARAGGQSADGYVALIEPASAGSLRPEYHVRMLFREGDIPGGWRDSYNGSSVADKQTAFRPLYVFDGPPEAAPTPSSDPSSSSSSPALPRELWIACTGVPRSSRPILRIDTTSWKARPFNLADPQGDRRNSENRPEGLSERVPPIWLNPGTLLLPVGRGLSAVAVDPAKPFIPQLAEHIVCFTGPDASGDAIVVGDQIFLPGPDWFRVSRATLEARRLGPGLPFRGWQVRDRVRYFASAFGGIMALAAEDGNLFRFSVDPAHPLSRHAVPMAVPPLPAPPEPGVVEYGAEDFGPGTVTFRSGLGDLSFKDGAVTTSPDFDQGHHLAVRVKERERGLTLDEARGLSERFFHPSERQRVGLTDAQWEKFKPKPVKMPPPPKPGGVISWQPVVPQFPKEEAARLEALYDAYAKATDAAALAKAAVPLFAEARKLGERWAAEADAELASVQSTLTAKQWAMVRYEAVPN